MNEEADSDIEVFGPFRAANNNKDENADVDKTCEFQFSGKREENGRYLLRDIILY